MQSLIRMVAIGALSAVACAQTSQAQQYPSRSITIIVAQPPGAVADLNARQVGNHLSRRLSVPVVVENKPGAAGKIGAMAAAAARPDGHTLLYLGDSVTRVFIKDPGVDMLVDFQPVSMITFGRWALMVNPGLPAKTLQEFVAYARGNPGKLNAGAGSNPNRLLVEATASFAGIKMTVVQYNGGAAVSLAMLRNEVQFGVEPIPNNIGHLTSGALRPLFVTGPTRVKSLPDVPTALELGLSDLPAGFPQGIWAPAKVPQPIIQMLAAEFAAIMRMPEMQEAIERQNAEPVGSSPEEWRQMFESNLKRWTHAARVANFEPQ